MTPELKAVRRRLRALRVASAKRGPEELQPVSEFHEYQTLRAKERKLLKSEGLVLDMYGRVFKNSGKY
jgi:hypothetical protein